MRKKVGIGIFVVLLLLIGASYDDHFLDCRLTK